MDNIAKAVSDNHPRRTTGLIGTNACWAACLIKEASPRTRVVIVAEEDSAENRSAAIACGASALVAGKRIDRDLSAVIRSLLF